VAQSKPHRRMISRLRQIKRAAAFILSFRVYLKMAGIFFHSGFFTPRCFRRPHKYFPCHAERKIKKIKTPELFQRFSKTI
jgi:hypothetical protein